VKDINIKEGGNTLIPVKEGRKIEFYYITKYR
jgi:hypothetical protein